MVQKQKTKANAHGRSSASAKAPSSRKRPKLKSIKAKTTNFGSKRKLSRMGKKQQQGLTGASAHFVTRAKALKMLRLSLRDFRRLCILKGIYPRDPKKKLQGGNKTYYHMKDIAFLHHEPLLDKFRDFKAFMKKVKRKVGKNEKEDAQKMLLSKPRYTLDHLVRERYPKFQSAIADLDDALTLVHLFAYLPAAKSVSAVRTEACSRLCREWQFYVSKSHSLRKVFVSIKGLYFEADIQGQNVLWIVPHRFAQKTPSNVDYKVMLTFLEFYECLLSFVLFKLFHDLGLRYPPMIEDSKDSSGEFLASVVAERIDDDSNSSEKKSEKKKEMTSKVVQNSSSNNNNKLETLSKEQTLALKKILNNPSTDQEGLENEEEEEKIKDEMDEFEGDQLMLAVNEKDREIKKFSKLFQNLTFYVNREVPSELLEFCVLSFHGKLVKEMSASVTHFVTDRSMPQEQRSKTCEYIQPQWVFDSINTRMVLPTTRYDPDTTNLPPHLSPFVNNREMGYTPQYATELEELRAARGLAPIAQDQESSSSSINKSKLNNKEEEDKDEDSEEEEEEEDDDDSEEEEEEEEDDDDSEEEEEEDDDESEEEEEEEPSKPEKKRAKVDEEPKKAPFIPSSRFKNAMPGYGFKRGPQGLGYYLLSVRPITFSKFGVSKLSKRAQRKSDLEEEKERAKMVMSSKAKRLYGRMQHGIEKKREEIEALKKKRLR